MFPTGIYSRMIERNDLVLRIHSDFLIIKILLLMLLEPGVSLECEVLIVILINEMEVFNWWLEEVLLVE